MAGIDSYTKLLLQADDQADASTTFTDTSGTGKTVETVGGSAQIDTARYKFAAGAMLFDGNGDYIEYADHADWDLNATDWTVDMWIYPTVINATKFIVARPGTSSGYSNFLLFIAATGRLYFSACDGTTQIINIRPTSTVLTVNNWHHIAIDRYGNLATLYVDGSATGSQSSLGSQAAVATKLRIGGDAESSATSAFAGSIDEFRWSKGVSRYQGSNFTPESAKYSLDASGRILTTNKGWI